MSLRFKAIIILSTLLAVATGLSVLAIELENGEFDMSDEAPAFGEDESLYEDSAVEGVEVDDPTEEDISAPVICKHGRMAGHYAVSSTGIGSGRGSVRDSQGELIGYVKLIWGTHQDGTPVAFGKYIDREGKFRGLLQGKADQGQLQLKWLTSEGELGKVRGSYGDPPTTFVARWAQTNCE